MPNPTLDEFILSKQGPRNKYVEFPGFEHMYVRHGKRLIWALNRVVEPVLDFANIQALEPGNGSFTNAFNHVRKQYPNMWIYVECVLNERFGRKLIKMGFTLEKQTITPSYYMPSPAEEMFNEVHRVDEVP